MEWVLLRVPIASAQFHRSEAIRPTMLSVLVSPSQYARAAALAGDQVDALLQDALDQGLRLIQVHRLPKSAEAAKLFGEGLGPRLCELCGTSFTQLVSDDHDSFLSACVDTEKSIVIAACPKCVAILQASER